jgi:uncharacterized protein (TIGR03067 family)
MGGQNKPSSGLTQARIVISGRHFTTSGMGATYEGTLELNTTKTPKALDLIFSSGPEAGTRSLGIYELDGDSWKLCLTTTAAPRPTKFATEPGSGNALETLTRETATADHTPREGGANRARAISETTPDGKAQPRGVTELEGECSMVSGISNGQPFDPMGVKYGKRVTKGDETTVLFGPEVYLRVKFTIDSSKTPKAIDYVHLQGQDKGKVQYGVYELEGGTLRVCTAPIGQERPKDFATTPGDGRTLTVWTKKP